MANHPTSYIIVNPRHIVLVTPTSRIPIKTPQSSLDDPDAFATWISNLARSHNIDAINEPQFDEKGEFWTLDEYTRHGV